MITDTNIVAYFCCLLKGEIGREILQKNTVQKVGDFGILVLYDGQERHIAVTTIYRG